VDPVPDPLLLRKSGSAGNGTRTSGSVARNSDHLTTEVVAYLFISTHMSLRCRTFVNGYVLISWLILAWTPISSMTEVAEHVRSM
jgi:hypothetical protein